LFSKPLILHNTCAENASGSPTKRYRRINFGSRLNANAQHDAQGIPAISGQSRRENGRDIIRWCFADQVTAALFQKEFGKSTRIIVGDGLPSPTVTAQFPCSKQFFGLVEAKLLSQTGSETSAVRFKVNRSPFFSTLKNN
jgi:hypothetical protein